MLFLTSAVLSGGMYSESMDKSGYYSIVRPGSSSSGAVSGPTRTNGSRKGSVPLGWSTNTPRPWPRR